MTTMMKFNANPEYAVLGTIIFTSGRCMQQCLGRVTSDGFKDESAGKIYEACEAISNRGMDIDAASIKEELVESHGEEAKPHLSVLSQIEQSYVVSSAYLKSHLYFLEERTNRAKLEDKLVSLAIAANKGLTRKDYLSIQEQLDEAHMVSERLGRLGEPLVSDPEFIEKAFKKENADIKYGFPSLDRMSGGMWRGEVHVVAGRPGNAKSTFLVQLAINLARQGKKTIFASLELPLAAMADKFCANLLGKRMKDVASHEEDHYKKELRRIWSDEWKNKLVVGEARNVFSVLESARGEDFDVLIIDYVQFGLYRETVRMDIAKAMDQLKALAKKRNVAVVVAAQLNRNSTGREDLIPQISDIKESGSVEEFACTVMLMHYLSAVNPFATDPNQFQIILGKSRYGQIGVVDFNFDAALGRFEEYNNEMPDQIPLAIGPA